MKDIIVIGASSGGIEALKILVGGLPSDFKASIFVVLHISPQSPGILHEILGRAGRLPTVIAKDGERVRSGHIYVATPDRHLLVEPGRVRVTRGPKENRFRPAVDPLFRSAAQAYGPRAIGIVLTGGLDDGTAGLWAVKQLGGVTVVQDPREAFAPSMPESAYRYVQPDYCLPVAEIAPLLVRLTGESAGEKGASQVPEELDIEIKIAKEDKDSYLEMMKFGTPSMFTCPECHGVLLQLMEAERVRFRCHTGHAFSSDSLLAEVAEKVEEAQWNAVRSVQENAILLRHMAQHLRGANDAGITHAFLEKAQEAQRRADLLKQIVMSDEEPAQVVVSTA